jgi:hypothetical protein
MRGAIPPLSQYAFMAWCLFKHRDNFTFTFTEMMETLKGRDHFEDLIVEIIILK